MFFVCVKYVGCARFLKFFLLVTDIWFPKSSAVKGQGLVRGGLLRRSWRIIAERGKNRTPRRRRFCGVTPHYLIVTNSLPADEARPVIGYLHISGFCCSAK
jgi:hypothetical protein